ncbi:ABC transporter permease [Lactobacillus xylocopicola]|uniref:ABC transporter permease n=1 Tax=Lactobacillus xylocopicola TaxID=2976676 RepID=A0ABM8BFB1_9LACO|nr:FtsX-like permease family protein [Lactobacillus xylocopicola]BDR59903.1 ABC transporter permease [Lactobacillus xylocopicola]
MVWKLAMTGVKSRLKDYLVLFSGLAVASMTFYMFLTIAINPAFITQDVEAPSNYLNFIFTFGIVLLVIIALVYLIYANSFLLSLRQHDYGMFMMLGAKSSRIGLLIFGETLIIGLVATVIGIVLGFGLTGLVSQLLIKKLELPISHFQVILPQAVLWTIIFFIIMFSLGALRNARKLTHTPVIKLLREDQEPVKIKSRPLAQAVEAVLGLTLLAAGYFILSLPGSQIFFIIPTALITIVVGSYLTFKAFFSALINFLLRKNSFSYHGLRMFTLGQLKFRLREYTRMLTMISLLFALALGAITVGLNFDTLKEQAKVSTYYDTTLVSNSALVQKEVAKLTLKSQQTYHYKETSRFLYFKQTEFTGKPIKNAHFYLKNGKPGYRIESLPVAKLAVAGTRANNVFSTMIPNGLQKKIRLVPAAKWRELKGQNKFISLLKVKDFDRDYTTLLKIQKAQLQENRHYSYLYDNSKPSNYSFIVHFSAGFEFMGFFLGFAFLTMLASTLMFKVLSGAAADRSRYQMLHQLGARNQLLGRSITQELGTLFLLPGLLGVVDVLFGLKLFRVFLPDPYNNIWIPFTVFFILYLFYYFITVKLYKKIVLNYR